MVHVLQDATDPALVAACLLGDEAAWRELIRRYGAYVYGVAARAYRLTGVAADEVFQDACVRIYDGLAGYTGSGPLRAWVRQVTLSACREHFRQAQRRRNLDVVEEEAAAELPGLEEALDVREAVAGLGEPCRSTIALYFWEDLTQSEVAKRLEVPEGTVAARVSRCLRRLRGRLQESGGDGPS